MLVAAAGCVVLGACVSVEVPKLPTGDLPAHWRNAEVSPALGPTPNLTGWWKQFHDPALNALVERALNDNLDVAQAVLSLRAARVLEDASSATYKPHLSFRTLEQPNAENTASYFQAGFDATWELGLFGRSGANAHRAEANAGAAEVALQGARVSLVAEVVREYLELRAAQRRETLLAAASRSADETERLLRIRERLKMASGHRVGQAAAAAAQAQAQAAGPRAAIAQHAQALALLVGQSEPDPAWLRPQPLPQLAVGNVASVPANLLRTRPEIRAAEMRVLKAAGEAGIAKADMYPRLALGSSLTFAALVKGHSHLGDVNNSFAIGPIIDIPLFNWGQRRAVTHARDDQLQAAVLAYRQAVLRGAAEVETDLARLHAAGQSVQGADSAVLASQDSVAMDEKLMRLGRSDDLELADARFAFAQSELERTHTRLAQGLAFVALYKALGGAPLPDAQDACTAHANPAGGPASAAARGGCGTVGSSRGAGPRHSVSESR